MTTDKILMKLALEIERVKDLLEKGHSCSEIATILKIPESTVRSHMSKIEQVEAK